VYGWPREDAIQVAVDTILAAEVQLEDARIVALDEPAFQAVRATIRAVD
jgi:hypothetical protein